MPNKRKLPMLKVNQPTLDVVRVKVLPTRRNKAHATSDQTAQTKPADLQAGSGQVPTTDAQA